MSRNYELFPDDDNGNVLWQMVEDGNDLKEPHEFEFSIVYKEQADLEKCAMHLLHQEQKVSFFQEDQHIEGSDLWVLNIHVTMIPEYEDIEDLEQWFTRIGQEFNGDYDGWGCMSYLYEYEEDDEQLHN